MQLKGFLKRALPFLLTFAVGLAVASLFVNVAAPNFNFKKRNHRCREFRENSRLRTEMDNLRRDNESLRRQLADAENEVRTIYIKPDFDSDIDVPLPPPPPVAPKYKSGVKMADPTIPAIIR
jgi:hypothetical protein